MSKLEYSRSVAAALNRLEGAEFVVATAKGSWEKLMGAGRYIAALAALRRVLQEGKAVPAADAPRLAHLRAHWGSMSSFAAMRQVLVLRNLMSARDAAIAARSFAAAEGGLESWLRQIRQECRRLSATLAAIDEPYDVLLDRHAPGLRYRDLAKIEAAIMPTCRAAALARDDVAGDTRFAMGRKDQMALARVLLDKCGVDRRRAQIAWNAGAPFCRGYGDGVKIVMRDNGADFTTMVLDLLHEAAGHGACRQNGPVTCAGIVAGAVADETAPLMLEHFLTKRVDFSAFLHAAMEEAGVNRNKLSADDIHRHMRRGRENSRLDADLRLYPLYAIHRIHVVRDLVNGRAEARDLPNLWAYHEARLGLPPSGKDDTACLQDLQMFTGYAGYFGSYLPALIAAAQAHEAMMAARPAIDAQLRRGDFSGVARWLKETIHMRGANFKPDMMPYAFIRHMTAHYGGRLPHGSAAPSVPPKPV